MINECGKIDQRESVEICILCHANGEFVSFRTTSVWLYAQEQNFLKWRGIGALWFAEWNSHYEKQRVSFLWHIGRGRTPATGEKFIT